MTKRALRCDRCKQPAAVFVLEHERERQFCLPHAKRLGWPWLTSEPAKVRKPRAVRGAP